MSPGVIGEDISNEKTAFAELIAWAKDRPRWQQDALRRLVLNDALTEQDIDDLAGICLDPKAPSQPITSAHVAAGGASGEPIALLRIENPTGINALAANQTLEFAKNGLTVIYGDNGSGKSGYVRVLKHACRTRDRGTKTAVVAPGTMVWGQSLGRTHSALWLGACSPALAPTVSQLPLKKSRAILEQPKADHANGRET